MSVLSSIHVRAAFETAGEDEKNENKEQRVLQSGRGDTAAFGGHLGHREDKEEVVKSGNGDIMDGDAAATRDGDIKVWSREMNGENEGADERWQERI